VNIYNGQAQPNGQHNQEILSNLKQPDDYRQPEASFHGNETAGIFLDQQENYPKRQAVERSFETQSGYLVLIKQLGSRYALSFKRQIGTPPTSSIFLTADEGQRLANILGSNSRQQNDCSDSTNELEQHLTSIRPSRNRRRRSAIMMPTILFTVSLVLWIVLAILVYQAQCQGSH